MSHQEQGAGVKGGNGEKYPPPSRQAGESGEFSQSVPVQSPGRRRICAF